MPPQIRAFYKFHVYFTVRRILYQLGGIQSISALPGDLTFDKSNNHYEWLHPTGSAMSSA